MPVGEAIPFRLDRHVHPQVPQAERPPAEPTGVDYLGMVLGSFEEATREGVSYSQLDFTRHQEDDL